jgi:drug/metabolite transporter (DMT)-like permease
MALLLAFASSILYGGGDFLGAFASRRAGALVVTAITQALGLAALLIALPFVAGHAGARDLAWGVGGGLSGSTGVLLLYYCLAAGTVSTLAPVISLIAIAVPVAFAAAAGEPPGAIAIAGIVAGAVGVALIGAGDSSSGASGAPRAQSATIVPAALLSGLTIGVFLVCIGRIGAGSGLLPLVIARGTGTSVFALVLLVRRTVPRLPGAAWGPALGCAVADVTANLLYMSAAQRGPLAIMATIVSLAPATTVVLAQLVMHERLSNAQRAGVALTLVAVALLARGAGH